jgi:hypothetical protein
MSVKHTKTGAERYRVEARWFRSPLLVLQVEIHAKGYEPSNPYGFGHDVDHCYWRDAQIQDITEGKLTNE